MEVRCDYKPDKKAIKTDPSPADVLPCLAESQTREGMRLHRLEHKIPSVNKYMLSITPEDSQVEVFYSCQPLLQSTVSGFNSAIFSYGHSGSGKTQTYTIKGSIFTKEDIEDVFYESEMPDQPQILEKEQAPEKAPTVNHTHKESVKVIPLKSTKLVLEKELESLILRYTNLKSKHEEAL
ncbi:LOW QUALITY PROTEIN: hypothetical protein DAPPUDRAFT_264377 [Daphnia pulex]|uniref:Kinesin motor domain-containing protein n=1 Tax=Daphnia pulex TaxID=6669 RepID=E9HRG6_DAPPU|nr:LOW QUALITY PROTEIN: hypothetical protein DAPPUDRAFT_264377 [Daphnia pulex]|eukprot:EFX65665.1 LOW QUALITY PROTEIN: hypothetical protein DAPPUDRAFT_264377 [Daphnia pulex]